MRSDRAPLRRHRKHGRPGRAAPAASSRRSAVTGPTDTPWNTRDLRVADPAGHRLVFTERNPNPDPEQAARIAAMFARKD